MDILYILSKKQPYYFVAAFPPSPQMAMRLNSDGAKIYMEVPELFVDRLMKAMKLRNKAMLVTVVPLTEAEIAQLVIEERNREAIERAANDGEDKQ